MTRNHCICKLAPTDTDEELAALLASVGPVFLLVATLWFLVHW